MLRHAADHPGLLTADTAAAFGGLAGAGLLDAGPADDLARATLLLRNVQAFTRQCLEEGALDEESVPGGLKAALANACGAESFAALKAALVEVEAGVYEAYRTLIGEADGETDKLREDANTPYQPVEPE